MSVLISQRKLINACDKARAECKRIAATNHGADADYAKREYYKACEALHLSFIDRRI